MNRNRVLPAILILILMLCAQLPFAGSDCFDPAKGLPRAEAIAKQQRIFSDLKNDLRQLDLTEEQIDMVIRQEFPSEYSHLADAILQEMEEQATMGQMPVEERAWRAAQVQHDETRQKAARSTTV